MKSCKIWEGWQGKKKISDPFFPIYFLLLDKVVLNFEEHGNCVCRSSSKTYIFLTMSVSMKEKTSVLNSHPCGWKGVQMLNSWYQQLLLRMHLNSSLSRVFLALLSS